MTIRIAAETKSGREGEMVSRKPANTGATTPALYARVSCSLGLTRVRQKLTVD